MKICRLNIALKDNKVILPISGCSEPSQPILANGGLLFRHD
jgi:hypothetical protein